MEYTGKRLFAGVECRYNGRGALIPQAEELLLQALKLEPKTQRMHCFF